MLTSTLVLALYYSTTFSRCLFPRWSSHARRMESGSPSHTIIVSSDSHWTSFLHSNQERGLGFHMGLWEHGRLSAQSLLSDHKPLVPLFKPPKEPWWATTMGPAVQTPNDAIFIHHQSCSREELHCGRWSISRWTNNPNHSWHRLQIGGLFSPLEHSQPHHCYRKLVATDKTTPGTGRGVQATHSVLSYSAVREPQAKG